MAQKSLGAIYPDLEGKSVIVTGGGSGIGAAIVRAFVRQKARVGFIDIAEAPSTALIAELGGERSGVRFAKADIRNIDALRAGIAALTNALGVADVLINNAAHDERHGTLDVTPEMFDERIAVNLRHAFFAAQAVARRHRVRHRGSQEAAGRASVTRHQSPSRRGECHGLLAFAAINCPEGIFHIGDTRLTMRVRDPI